MNKMKLLACTLAGIMGMGLGQNALAHTRLNVATETEGKRVINHVVIGHNCGGDTRVIGTSIVFPEGANSTILQNGQPYTGLLLDFLTNYGNNAQMIVDRTYDQMDEKVVDGKVVGFWAGGGAGLPANLTATIPFRHTFASIEPKSCAKSVKIMVSIADICEITSVSGFKFSNHGVGIGTVGLWTHNDLHSQFDRVSEKDDGPASYTITRDLTKNPLPSSCGEGVNIVVKPSAAQINRDMPIIINGKQIWPKP